MSEPISSHCTFAAGEIRILDDERREPIERADLLALAAILERRGATEVVQRLTEDELTDALVDLVGSVHTLFGEMLPQAETGGEMPPINGSRLPHAELVELLDEMAEIFQLPDVQATGAGTPPADAATDFDVFEIEQQGPTWFLTLVRPDGSRFAILDTVDVTRARAEAFARSCARIRGRTAIRIIGGEP